MIFINNHYIGRIKVVDRCMSVVVQFKKYISKLVKFIAIDPSPAQDSAFSSIEQKRLNELIAALQNAVEDDIGGVYVKASKINHVKIRTGLFLDDNLQAVVAKIAPYCDAVLKDRRQMLLAVLNAIKYCKAVPGFVISADSHFNEDDLKVMTACFEKDISSLPEYFSQNNYETLIMQLRQADLFLETHVNIALRVEQKKQEAACLEFIYAAKPPAREKFAAGDFGYFVSEEMLAYYAKRHHKYGLTPVPHSAHAPSSTKIAVAPRKTQSARPTSCSNNGDNARKSSERPKPFVPLLKLSQLGTPGNTFQSPPIEQLAEKFQQCNLDEKGGQDDKQAEKKIQRRKHRKSSKH